MNPTKLVSTATTVQVQATVKEVKACSMAMVVWEGKGDPTATKVPTACGRGVQCKHYAVSPMGYWGCDWLFEDGTCGNTEFFPTIRWDGLDAYVMPKPDKDAEPGEQWHSDKYYQNEILPGGNPVNHDYYTL